MWSRRDLVTAKNLEFSRHTGSCESYSADSDNIPSFYVRTMCCQWYVFSYVLEKKIQTLFCDLQHWSDHLGPSAKSRSATVVVLLVFQAQKPSLIPRPLSWRLSGNESGFLSLLGWKIQAWPGNSDVLLTACDNLGWRANMDVVYTTLKPLECTC